MLITGLWQKQKIASPPIPTPQGVRQGNSVSPLFFNLIIINPCQNE